MIPFEQGREPGDLPHAKQRDLDAVFRAYAERPRKRVESATILELDRWHTGQNASGKLERLFRARDLVCVSALSKRRLFHGHFGYCNAHHYELVVQAFEPGNVKAIAFTTRRRDGASNYLWGANEFAFHRPLHVASDCSADLDEPLLRALLRLPKSEAWVYEAIREFNAANTDSSDVPLHVEVVMAKSAFEWLFGIDHDARKFVKAILQHLAPATPASPPRGPLSAQWLARNPTRGVLEAWASEFCVVRNRSAHAPRGGPKLVWSVQAHLAFVAIAFPLLLKKVLADIGRYRLTDRDRLELGALHQYLGHDPMKEVIRPDRHPWNKILDDVVLRDGIAKVYDRTIGRLLPKRRRARIERPGKKSV